MAVPLCNDQDSAGADVELRGQGHSVGNSFPILSMRWEVCGKKNILRYTHTRRRGIVCDDDRCQNIHRSSCFPPFLSLEKNSLNRRIRGGGGFFTSNFELRRALLEDEVSTSIISKHTKVCLSGGKNEFPHQRLLKQNGVSRQRRPY